MDDMFAAPRNRRPEAPRKSGVRALAFWTVALIAGGAAALLLRWYMDRGAQPVAAPTTKLVVAAREIPVAKALESVDLRLTEWPATSQPTGGVRDPAELIGRVVLSRMVAGEPVLTSKIAGKDAGRGLAALIPRSMRAVAVRVDEVVGVAGFIHSEDRVDVVVTMRPPKPADAESTSKVILQNVKVLAVGRQLDTGDSASRIRAVPVTVATLLVTPEESEKLALVSSTARILLSLRGWTDVNAVDTPGATASTLFAGVDVLTRARVAATSTVSEPARRSSARSRTVEPASSALPAASVATSPQKEVVEILRGDRLEQRKFDTKEDK